MKRLRSIYNIYHLVKGTEYVFTGRYDGEEFVEMKEFESEEEILKYLDDLKSSTKEEYTARLAVLLVRNFQRSSHGKQHRER
jgi:hypothetical protein